MPGGSERRAGARDDVEVIEHPEDPLGENPLVHSFEKVHTIEQYTGGRKRIDASDELEAHGDALDEAAPRQVVRSLTRRGLRVPGRRALRRSGGRRRRRSGGRRRAVRRVGRREAERTARAGVGCVRPWRHAGPAPTSSARCGARHRRHIDDLRALFERLEAVRAWRLRQPDGPDIDVDAVIDRYAGLRAGSCADDKLYAARRRHSRDVAMLVLLDASMSTDGWVANRRVMDVEKESVVVLGEALSGLYDEVAVAAFYSQTRRDCRFVALKGFREPWATGYDRVWGLEPRGYTRVGPALRHATDAARCAQAPGSGCCCW